MFGKFLMLTVSLFAMAGNGMCSSDVLPSPVPSPSHLSESTHMMFDGGVLFFQEGFDFSALLSQIPGARWKPIPKVSSPQISVMQKRVTETITNAFTTPLAPADAEAPQLHHQMEAPLMINPIEQLQASIEAIDETLAFVHNPNQLIGLADLPKENKSILLDLASTLVEEGKVAFTTLREALRLQLGLESTSSFDSSATLINWGLQTGQNYKRYTEGNHTEFLQSLVNCFIYSKGQEIQGMSPTISVEDLGILIRSAVDHSGYVGHSVQLLVFARQLETTIKE